MFVEPAAAGFHRDDVVDVRSTGGVGCGGVGTIRQVDDAVVAVSREDVFSESFGPPVPRFTHQSPRVLTVSAKLHVCDSPCKYPGKPPA